MSMPSPANLMSRKRIAAYIERLLCSGHLMAKAIRFTFVGVMSGLIYGAITAFCHAVLAIPAVPASLVGYCASVPMSFLGHRQLTFRANGHWTMEACRFVCSQIVNLTVTAGAMHAAVSTFDLPYYWGMAGTVIFVPIANFAFMNLWVFRDQAHNTGH